MLEKSIAAKDCDRSDMTDREWSLMAPFIPPAKQGGRRRSTDMREVANALLYVASAGCGLVPVLCRSLVSLCHLGFEGERADAAQI